MALSCDEVLRIAHDDAEHTYRNISDLRSTLSLGADGWHVDYELTGDVIAGGGPHYVIDPRDGKILSKRYEQ
ncbi:MAG TPA: hypothetical protein VKD72_27710 [Gemmataceae bacterium]|nr:hypothetical protein [Gemmataceae bacterium]